MQTRIRTVILEAVVLWIGSGAAYTAKNVWLPNVPLAIYPLPVLLTAKVGDERVGKRFVNTLG